MKTILWDLTQRLSFRDVFLPAIAGRSAGPESIVPAVVMDSGLAYPALRASHAPRNDDCCWWSLRKRGQKRELRKIVTAECRFGARVPGSSAAVRTKTLTSKGAINCLDLSPTSQRHQRAALIYGSKLSLEGTMTASLSPADIPPAADAAAFQPRSRVGVVATGASSAPPANRTGAGLAFGEAPASVPAPAAPVVAASSLSGTTIPAHQLSETTEVQQATEAAQLAEARLQAGKAAGASDTELKKLQLEVESSKLALAKALVQQARVAAQLAEARLYGAIMAGGAFDAELKKLQLEVASSKLALAKASGEPADRVENLSDKVVVAKVLLAAATANENDVVAFIRGNHLFMNNIEVDYVRKLSPSERNEIIKQCGAHVRSMHIKPGEIVALPSAPSLYREFIDKYPALRPTLVDKPRLIAATSENLAKIKLIRERQSEIKYMSDMDQWGKLQQWDAGETGKGDCEDFATFALKLCMEAGFPREACLITFAIDNENDWHIFLTVRTTKGDWCIDRRWQGIVTPQQQKDLGYTQAWLEDPFGRTDEATGTYKWVWSPYGD